MGRQKLNSIPQHELNRHGKLSPAPGGYGTMYNGYRRICVGVEKLQRFEHDVVWENAHGKIPIGFCIHHKDGNKLNNDLLNLELVDPLVHGRIHSGCVQIDGEWWKPCRKCGKLQPIENYYKRNTNWVYPWCKKCCANIAIFNYYKRKYRVFSGGNS